jgi:hypothetical protein
MADSIRVREMMVEVEVEDVEATRRASEQRLTRGARPR